jgi:metal-dependent amidase/aminoacylase/carboxypeptidase family protein
MRKDGNRVDISLAISPVKNAEGKIIGASKIARDITERKRNEAQIAILAREAEHRAKNVLATAQATVRLSNSDTPEGLKHAIEGRIQALANVTDCSWKLAGLEPSFTVWSRRSLPATAETEWAARVLTVLTW